nr:exocyst complex component EXO84B [Ipomoea batatas]
MVSELAGEGAMPLPKSASHAELQGRLRQQIRSSLRRGVFPAKTVALFNPSTMFIPLSLDVFIRSRSAKILSTELVAVVSSSQRRTREKKQLITPIRDFSSEKSQGERRVSDMKNRVGKLRSEIEIEAPTTNIEEAIKRKRFRGAVAEIDSWSRSMDTNLCSVFSKLESAISPVSEMSFSSTLSSRSAMVKVCVEEHNKSFIWIWLVLIAIACCENMVFVAILKQREAPNVMPTGRSPAIPIMVQWSAAKDRSLDYDIMDDAEIELVAIAATVDPTSKLLHSVKTKQTELLLLEQNFESQVPCLKVKHSNVTVWMHSTFIRASKEILDLETELSLIRSLLATLINNLAEGVHIDSLFDSLPDSATNSSSNDEISEPSDIENWLTEFPDHLDVLLAVRRVDETLSSFDEGECIASEAKENKTQCPLLLASELV